MSDNWEDWENSDFSIPVLNVPNEGQLKRLEERKLVEQSDNELSKVLFSNEEEDLVYEELSKIENKNITPLPTTEKKPPKKTDKQKINEQKQKEMSKTIKEEKFKKEKEKEIFGEAEDDNEFAEYEDMFY